MNKMRYIKTFNEAITWHPAEFKQELKDFCENNLAYLLDMNNTSLYVTDINDWDEYNRKMEDYFKVTLNCNKKWIEIKDYVIPFLTRLNKEYEVVDLYLTYIDPNKTTSHGQENKYKIENLINDKLGDQTIIFEIYLFIEDYKKEKPKGILTKIKSFFK